MKEKQEGQKQAELKVSDLRSFVSFSKWCISNIDSMKERAAKIGSDQISVYEARKVLEFLLDDISSDKYGVFLEAIKNLIKRLDSYEKNDKKFIP